MNKKAQTSVDFMIMFGFCFLLFLFFFQFFLKDLLVQNTDTQIQLSARSEAEKVASSIESVTFVGNSSTMTFSLPSTLIKNTPYNITVLSSGVIFVSYLNKEYTFVVATKAVNRSFLTGGIHNVTNVKGVVYIA